MAIHALRSNELGVIAGGLIAPGLSTAIATLGAAPLAGPSLYAPNFVVHVIQRVGRNPWARLTLTPAPVVTPPVI